VANLAQTHVYEIPSGKNKHGTVVITDWDYAILSEQRTIAPWQRKSRRF
jgi:hypothetical protein